MFSLITKHNFKFKKTKIVVFLTLLIYISNLFMPIYSVLGVDTNISDITVYSKAAILLDSDTGDILYSKNGDSQVYPASTTKILTAILAIEKLDLKKTVVVSKTAILLPYGSSNVALKEGEVISVEDLLYCLLLNSGNDSANAIAEAVSGTIPNFILLMNEKTKELGLTGTNFTNPHGYNDVNHYTTPSDMMKLLKYAIKNEKFRTITGTKEHIVKITNKTTTERILQNTNRLILTKDDSYLSDYYEYCLGGKTGFTDEAGRTFVAFGTKNNRNVIFGTFNVMNIGSKDGRYIDAKNLFEYGFNNFTNKLAIKKDDFKFEYIDKNSKLKYVLGIQNDIYFSTKNMRIENSETNNRFNTSITNDIDQTLINNYKYNTTEEPTCQVVGDINIKFSNDLNNYYKQVPLIVLECTKLSIFESFQKTSSTIFKIIIYILLFISLLVFLIILLLIRKAIKKSIRYKKKLLKAKMSADINYIDPNYLKGYIKRRRK